MAAANDKPPSLSASFLTEVGQAFGRSAAADEQEAQLMRLARDPLLLGSVLSGSSNAVLRQEVVRLPELSLCLGDGRVQRTTKLGPARFCIEPLRPVSLVPERMEAVPGDFIDHADAFNAGPAPAPRLRLILLAAAFMAAAIMALPWFLH